MHIPKFLIILSALVLSLEARSDAVTLPLSADDAKVSLDLPALQLPFNFANGGYLFPSMRQSLLLSTDFLEASHFLIAEGSSDPTSVQKLIIIGSDILTTWIPFGMSWEHEEWHRAVLSNQHIGSFNDVYNFPIGQSSISVSHVGDNDLIQLKKDRPSDFVRLAEAGMEAQTAQNMLIEQHHFFKDSKLFDYGVLWSNALTVSQYVFLCASSDANSQTDDFNKSDGSDIPKRDFTGLDCTAWTYDLHRPNEPYQARGTHPSGVGINRYIKNSSLAPGERDFLQKQAYLSVLNFADPFLFGQKRFKTQRNGEDASWNAKLNHYLTSFGYTVDAHLFWQEGSDNLLLTVHNGFNESHYFPGVTVQWLEKPLPWRNFSMTDALTLWAQPKDQLVQAENSDLLVDLSTELAYQFQPQRSVYFGLEAKTPGWIAGNVALDRNVTVWTGLRLLEL